MYLSAFEPSCILILKMSENELTNKASYGKIALTSSSALLAAQWVMAAVSIPSANDYATQLADGTAPENIVTMYDNLSLLITITLVWTWIATTRFLLPLYDQVTEANPEAIKYRRLWVTWGWLAPVVSFWFPKRIIDGLLKSKVTQTDQQKLVSRATGTWWATWISFVLINDLSAFNAITGAATPIQPSYEIAAACMLTASYTVWSKILKTLAS